MPLSKPRSPTRRPVIQTFELKAYESDPGHTLTPNLMFDPAIGARASSRIGHIAYAILRSQVIVALPQLRLSLGNLASALDEAAVRAERTGQQSDRDRANQVGRATHWDAIVRLGIVVENLCATLAALDGYLSDASVDVTTMLLRHDLDLLKVLSEKKRRQLGYWERLAAMPDLQALTDYGLQPEEARAVRRAYRGAAFGLLGSFLELRDYYTPELHQVYLRHKHGYTLVAPSASQLHLKAKDPSGTDLDRALQSGFAVVHQTRERKRVLQIVRSTGTDLADCLRVADAAAELASSVASTWLWMIEHPEGHTLQVLERSEAAQLDLTLRGARKWAGDEMANAYALDRTISQIRAAAERTTTPLDAALIEAEGALGTEDVLPPQGEDA
jgi:hypothetical protein